MNDRQTTDRKNLADALAIARFHYPNAAYLLLETSDQNHYGFLFRGVELADGTVLTDPDDDLPATLVDHVNDSVCDLNWNDAVGEDKHGNARVPVGEPVAEPGTLSLDHVKTAAEHLRDVIDESCLLTDPEGIGNRLTCTEANAFAGLLLAVGLKEQAASLIIQHADHDDDTDDRDHVRLRDLLVPMQATGYDETALTLALDAF